MMSTQSHSIPALPASTDVVIVGAGPTGLTLANTLAARGTSFVVLDQATQGGNTSRAAVVHARTLEVLDQIGVSDDLCRRGIVVPRFTVRDRDRVLLEVPFDGLPTRYPYTLMIPQNITEEVLAEHLIGRGGTVHWQHAVTRLDIRGSDVTVTVTRPDGTPGLLQARYVVGCDGLHSVVREQAAIGFTGDRYAESFVLADVQMDWPFPRDEVNLFFSPKGLVVVAPLPGQRYRVVATLDEAPERPTIADVQALLDQRGPRTAPASVRNVVWGSRFRVHHRIADAFRRGPLFLAGDAAHVHSPAGGQGMNTGIQDAATLARLLADVLAGGDDRLDDYEASRRPVAAAVVTMTDRLTRAATARNPLARTVRNTVLRLAGRLAPVRRALAMNLSELSTDPNRTRGDQILAPSGDPEVTSPPRRRS
jgi:2-polyprenyl-6-methoxyphenol hydroxylase-like FAD-dependent oxidoreductase